MTLSMKFICVELRLLFTGRPQVLATYRVLEYLAWTDEEGTALHVGRARAGWNEANAEAISRLAGAGLEKKERKDTHTVQRRERERPLLFVEGMYGCGKTAVNADHGGGEEEEEKGRVGCSEYTVPMVQYCTYTYMV